MATSESRGVGVSQSNLHQQDLSKLDVSKLTAVSPEVISRQATINIGTIGHVAHGKSTVVKAISGVQTVRFKNELERNITIKLEKLPEAVINEYRRTDTKSSNKRKANNKNMSHKNSKKRKTETKDEYIVESIVDMQILEGSLLFQIKWKGFPHSDNTMEPIDNLSNCPVLVESFLGTLAHEQGDKITQLREEITREALDRVKLEELWTTQGHTTGSGSTGLALLLALLLLPQEEEVHRPQLEKEARAALQQQALADARQNQLCLLQDWETHMNSFDPDGKISVVNDADLEGPPPDFRYINENVPAEGIVIPEDPPIGCECVSCNVKSKCSCALEGDFFAYSFKRRLRVDVGTPIYECNKSCRCPPDCTNRVVQSGRHVKLKIFRTSSGCGWGVRTKQRIPEGQFVCRYLGEIISCEEAERRARTADPAAPTYLFDLDFNSDDSLYTVDAARMGNVSHFINHSCEPNLGVWAVWGNCLDPNLPMLALFATRDIDSGEEITFDYAQKAAGPDEPPEEPPEASPTPVEGDVPPEQLTPKKVNPPTEKLRSPLKLRMDLTNSNGLPERVRPLCKCGAKSCRKYLF